MRVMGVILGTGGFPLTLMTLMTLFPTSVKFLESLFVDNHHAPYLAIVRASKILKPHSRFHTAFIFPNKFAHKLGFQLA